MKYIECPEVYTGNDTSLFLAGGITWCSDWQQEMISKLWSFPLTLLNPRRKNFDITNPLMEREQIAWEHEHLEKATMISFWFPPETLCPITLFELGKYLKEVDKILFVGVDDDYQRKRDLEIQIPLVRPELKIVSSIDALVDQIRSKLIEIRK